MPLGPRKPHVRSRRGEERTAAALGGRRMPGSGNQPHAKGDVRGVEFLAEQKDTLKKSYTLTRAELNKIRDEATARGLIPVHVLAFADSMDDKFATLRFSDFLAMAAAAGMLVPT